MVCTAELPLDLFLDGALVQQGLGRLAEVLDPVVKAYMRTVSPSGPVEEEVVRAEVANVAKLAAARQAVDETAAQLVAKKALLNANKKNIELRQEQHRLKKTLKECQKELDACAKQPGRPFWLLKCREAFPSDKMRKYINDDGKTWDAYSLGAIIQANMRRAFAKHLVLDERQAKGLLSRLLSLLQWRNWRAHDRAASSGESLEALRLMDDMLKAFGQPADDVKEALRTAQMMLTKARAGSSSVEQDMSQPQFERVVLFGAVREFVARLTTCCGEVGFKDKTITFGTDKPDDAFRFGPQFKARRAWVKTEAVKTMLKGIASGRHWLFHNTSDEIKVGEVLGCMEAVLVELEMTEAHASSWVWPAKLALCKGSVVTVVVQLIGSTAMRIPATTEQCMTGRDTEVETVAKALVSGLPGTRVLVHGLAGVGKDVVATAAVSDPGIAGAPGRPSRFKVPFNHQHHHQIISIMISSS